MTNDIVALGSVATGIVLTTVSPDHAIVALCVALASGAVSRIGDA